MRPVLTSRVPLLLLWLTRAAWLLVAAVVLSMLAVNIPHLYRDTVRETDVRQATAAALTVFPTYSAFIRYMVGLRLLSISAFVGMALFLAWRKWDNRFVLLVSATMLMLTFFFGISLSIEHIRYPRPLLLALPAIRILFPWLMFVAWLALFYVLPTGQFVPRWSALFILPGSLLTLATIGTGFAPSRNNAFMRSLQKLAGGLFDGFEQVLTTLDAAMTIQEVWLFLLFATAGVGLSLQIGRVTRETGARRWQLRWVVIGLIVQLALTVWVTLREIGFLTALGMSVSAARLFELHLLSIGGALLPLLMSISILRYRLWDISIIVNRTLVYGSLTLLLSIVYLSSVVVLQSLSQLLIGQRQSEIITVISTLAIAALFQPLQRWLQRIIDRRFYRRKYDAERTLEAFGERARSETELERLCDVVIGIVEETVQPAFVFLWLPAEEPAPARAYRE